MPDGTRECQRVPDGTRECQRVPEGARVPEVPVGEGARGARLGRSWPQD